MTLPPKWASNATFVGGDHGGEPTRVAPGAAVVANGFYPDLGFAAEHANHQLNAMSLAGRRQYEHSALKLRTMTRAGTTLDDAANFVAVLKTGPFTLIAVRDSGGAVQAVDSDRFVQVGIFASIPVGGSASGRILLATNGSRIVAAAENEIDYSDNSGGSWTAATESFSAAVNWLLYEPVSGTYILIVNGAAPLLSPTGDTSWTVGGAHGALSAGRAAALSSGRVLMIKSGAGAIAFRKSDDGGATWSDTSGTVDNSASITDSAGKGTVAGTLGSLVYHVGCLDDNTALQISATADGDSWVTLATITAASCGLSDFDGGTDRFEIKQCPDTGLLIIAAPANSETLTALFASPDGSDWVGPSIYYNGEYPAFSFAVAGGRVYAYTATQLMRSDGV